MDLQIPRVMVGTANLGTVLPEALVLASDRTRAFKYLDGMLELGCFAFDTAASYQLGGTERLIGCWMQSRRNRDRVFLISKGAHPYPIVMPNRVTPQAIRADLHASLRRLQIERIDLYLLHRDAPETPLEPILETLVATQKQGKIKEWGLSNWSHPRILAMDTLARKAGGSGVSASSPHFSLLEWVRSPWSGSVSIAGEANQEARSFYRKAQLPVLAWSPLGQGFLSGTREAPRIYAGQINIARKKRAETLAKKYKVASAQIGLAYLFAQPFPVFAVVAAGKVEKMKTNLEATKLHLSEQELHWLESGEESLPPLG
jgi:aryl-alcohol dehydrogenase-like predicted oxidoreductase